jgi:hypothetical protein
MAFSEAIVPSASRTAAPTNAPFNYTSNSQKFVDVIVDVTVNAGGLGSITVDVVGADLVKWNSKLNLQERILCDIGGHWI